jgi:transcriptional regulator with XRE-family HTH domain
MPRRKRTTAEIAGAREAQAIAATLGRDARSTRLRRRLTQRELGRRVGLGQSEISHLELGHGENTSIATWTAIGIALNRPLAIGFGRDVADPGPRDAGHLVAQEFVLRLGAATGRAGSFELPTRPANPALSIDVCLRDRRHGLLLVIEIWNRLDDWGRRLARRSGRSRRRTAWLRSMSHRIALPRAGSWSIPPPIANSSVAIPQSSARSSMGRRKPGSGRSRPERCHRTDRGLRGLTRGRAD